MFDRPGIDLDDLVWIHRDQFVHYLQLAFALGDPGTGRTFGKTFCER